MKAKEILQKKLKEQSNIYLLFGAEEFLINEFINNFIDKFVDIQFKDFNLSFIDDGRENFILDLISSANQLPFQAERRIIVAESQRVFTKKFKKEEKEKLEDLLRDFPQSSTLLFKAHHKPDKRTKIYKLFKEQGPILEFPALQYKKLDSWIKRKAKSLGKEIDYQAIELLKKSFNNNLQRLDMELNKVASFLGEEQLISAEKLELIISQDRLLAENIIFDFVDAIGNQNSSQALGLMNQMLTAGQSAIGLLMMMARQIRLILQVKVLNQQGNSIKEMAKRLKQHPYPIEKCLKQSRNFSILELKKALELIFTANLNLVTGQKKDLELELLVIRLGELFKNN